MRISDWSSDVCSSDLDAALDRAAADQRQQLLGAHLQHRFVLAEHAQYRYVLGLVAMQHQRRFERSERHLVEPQRAQQRMTTQRLDGGLRADDQSDRKSTRLNSSP